MGVLLYDADKIETNAALPDDQLLDAQLDMILDPHDPRVITAAKLEGIDDGWLDAAQRSPVYKFVKEWGMALPLHPEYRTVAMMFYVPPLSPVMSTIENNLVKLDLPEERRDFELLDELEKARLPLEYLANLFTVGDVEPIKRVLHVDAGGAHLQAPPERRRHDRRADARDAGRSRADRERSRGDLPADHHAHDGRPIRVAAVPPGDGDRRAHRRSAQRQGRSRIRLPPASEEGRVMKTTEIVALGYRYPTPSAATELSAAIADEHNHEVKRHMQHFLDGIKALSLGEWEELHTATLDLSAPFVPYVGHVIWGDNYKRGEFMSNLVPAMAEAGVDLHGELPDHIEPVLRYLAATEAPLRDLLDVLPGAVATMNQTLKRAAPTTRIAISLRPH